MTNVHKIEIYQDDAGEFRWRGKAGNNEIVADSEGYTTKFDARRAAETTFPDVEIVELSLTGRKPLEPND